MENQYRDSKIKVILIDDEPSRELKRGNDLRIHKKRGIEGFDGLEDKFELKWLRTTEDFKKYMDYIQHCEANSDKGLITEGIFIPEIICFDYSLDKGRTNAALFAENYDSNPFDEIETFFKNKGILIPEIGDQPEFDLNSLQTNKKYDLFGCFCGGLLVKQFKDYISVGIPTTQRNEKEVEGSYIEVFEWLINYDLKDAFNTKYRTQPYWHNIIEFAIDKLRLRIEGQVKSNVIKPSLIQLVEMASGIIPKDRVFTFSSNYGIRELPLDGLFIDKGVKFVDPIPMDILPVLEYAQKEGWIKKIEVTERDYEIWKFSSSLLKTLATANGIKDGTIAKAKRIADELWSASTGDVLRERFRLSELFSRKYLLNKKLSEEENKLFDKLCGYDFEVIDCNKILNQILGNEKLGPHLKKKIFSIKEHHNNKEDENKIKIILTTLFLALRLDFHYKEFRKNDSVNKKSNSLSMEFIKKPTWKELLYVLYPSPEKPILMLGHLQYVGGEYKSDIINEQFNKFYSRTDISGIDWIMSKAEWKLIHDDLDFSRIIQPGEKVICQLYATGLGMTKENYPPWLN